MQALNEDSFLMQALEKDSSPGNQETSEASDVEKDSSPGNQETG